MKTFEAAKVVITRKRFSATQGEVLIEYDGVRIEQFGDKIELRDGEWTGYDDAFWIQVAKREAIARGLATEPTPPAPVTSAAKNVRDCVKCDGLRARVKREVFAAAVAERSPERDASLAYWHARQRNVERLYYRLGQYQVRVPTRNQLGAAKHEDRYPSGGWIGSPEQLAEARQMGLTAL
ncbi:hypothetical protein [Sinorhizobium medicae]